MKKLIVLLVITLVMGVSLPSTAAAGPTVIVVPRDYPTIQLAIDNASPGDRIVVQAGTYAGAIVTKAVEIVGTDSVIDEGPYSHPGSLMAGFLFTGNGVGSGATIRGFKFVASPQVGRLDDGKLDFPIFSRGANGVTVRNNLMINSLQGITNWHGSGWNIAHNKLEGLSVNCGGGIGIFIGSVSGVPANDNQVEFNSVNANIGPDCAYYTTTGIALYSDARWGRLGGPVKDNRVVHNKSVVTGWFGNQLAGTGFEIADHPLAQSIRADVTDNVIGFNDFRGSTVETKFFPAASEGNNTISRNLGQNRGHGIVPASVFRPFD